MENYRFINADHSLVVTPDGHVIAWDPQANAPAAHQVGGPPLQPARRPPNERDEPLDVRDHAARASLIEAHPAVDPPDEMKLWREAGSPQPTVVGVTPTVPVMPSPPTPLLFTPAPMHPGEERK